MADLSGLAQFGQGLLGGLKDTSQIMNSWELLELKKKLVLKEQAAAERKAQMDRMALMQSLYKDIETNPDTAMLLLRDPANLAALGIDETRAAPYIAAAERERNIRTQVGRLTGDAISGNLRGRQVSPEVLARIKDPSHLIKSMDGAEEQAVSAEVVRGLQEAADNGETITPQVALRVIARTSNPGLAMKLFKRDDALGLAGGYESPELKHKKELDTRLETAINHVRSGGSAEVLYAELIRQNRDIRQILPFATKDLAEREGLLRGYISYREAMGQTGGREDALHQPVGTVPGSIGTESRNTNIDDWLGQGRRFPTRQQAGITRGALEAGANRGAVLNAENSRSPQDLFSRWKASEIASADALTDYRKRQTEKLTADAQNNTGELDKLVKISRILNNTISSIEKGIETQTNLTMLKTFLERRNVFVENDMQVLEAAKQIAKDIQAKLGQTQGLGVIQAPGGITIKRVE